MINWIRFPRIEGNASRQAHADIPDGCYEREMGKEGFFGPATHLYHSHPPTEWIEFEGPLRPRAFDTNKLTAADVIAWDVEPLFFNNHCRIRLWRCHEDMLYLARNSDGDELLFVHAGGGSLFCDFGHLTFTEGDYILLPRGTMWRLQISQPTTLLMIESTNGSYQLPDKGIVGPHAIFDPAILDTPHLDATFKQQQGENPWNVLVKRNNQISTIRYPFNPLDVQGWKGELIVVKVNWRDIRPLMSHRYHLPPSAHTTFVGNRFVVCTFCPRPIESDPGALKVPFYHNNDDFDELIFYHSGDFFSRDNIHPGMMTLHPCGFTHGPHPKAFAAGQKHAKKETDEVAVMIDARDALEITPNAMSVEWEGYVSSWRNSKEEK